MTLTACGHDGTHAQARTDPDYAAGGPLFVPSILGRWRVTEVGLRYGNASSPPPRPAPHGVFIDFEFDGSTSGFDGVNNWSGDYTEAGNKLRMTSIESTLAGLAAGAPAGFTETQAAFGRLFSANSATIRQTGNRLVLRVGDLSLVASRAPGQRGQ